MLDSRNVYPNARTWNRVERGARFAFTLRENGALMWAILYVYANCAEERDYAKSS